jgi:CRISPR-associated endonuclease Csn1
MSFKENSKIYYGLDIGTDSVGWSTTNEKYELLRYKNNLMWGVSLFEAASLAEDRRGHRTQRRRYDRRQQRVALLGELFAKEILKTDPDFFLRLKESSLYPEDRTSKNVNTYFDDADFKDSDYFKMYPTVHHLIKELSESNKPHDVRLVYLACAFIVAHRGHFLNGADENNVQAVLALILLIANLRIGLNRTI